MKRRNLFVFLILLLVVAIAGCGLGHEPGPTGAPEGKVGHSMVYADGNVYVQDIYDETLHYPDIPYGYSLYGTVEATGETAIPTEEGRSALMEVGTELYLAESENTYLFTRTDNGTENGSIRRYILLTESPLEDIYSGNEHAE